MPSFENTHNLNFQGSSFTEIHGSQYNIQNGDLDAERVLATLKPAVRCYVPTCMDGTRESVFKELDAWLDDYGSTPNIMWISGSPGAGKSAIASTLVSNLTRRQRLGSFFFFKRGDAILGDPATLWRTVASDLSRFDTDLRTRVVEFLARTEIRDGDIRLHFDCMIKEPLAKNCNKLSLSPPVVVIDALDECGLDDAQSAQRRNLLDTLTRWSDLPRTFKLVITSRNERLPSSFHDQSVCRKIVLETGESVNAETHKDIRIFFEKSFDDICPELGIASPWPGKPTIDRLTDRAAGLFIWAKTAIAFMKEKRGKPADKLKLLLDGDLGKGNENIDALYRQILDFSFNNVDDIVFQLFKEVVGAIIVAKAPLHHDDLKHFLGMHDEDDERQFNFILHSLSSVLDFDGYLRLRHLSFAEYLSDPKRCHDRHFMIDRDESHHDMALSCLRIMKTGLKFNICALKTSYVRNDDVLGLSERITSMIPTRLQYSCRFWAAHLGDTAVEQNGHESLLMEVKDFFHIRLLYWLEVMSLIKEVSVALIAVLSVARSQRIKDVDMEISDFARDASRFIANFYTPISESAPHIYLSALPFSPRKSMIFQQFSLQCPGTLSVVTGQEDHWPPLVNIFTGHVNSVFSVAYSPNGKHVVSGSYKTVWVWDVETTEIVAGPFAGHTGSVYSVAYSPDGKHVVSGSEDNTVRVWDVENDQIIAGPFEGHTNSVYSVAYSPDGKHVVSGSKDKTVRVWDVETGKIVAGPFEGHTDSVLSVAYSPNGKHVVSGSRTVRVWDVETGEIITCPLGRHIDFVRSVAYSPDGKHVVASSAFKTVAGPFECNIGLAWSVAYSPDGERVVSGSYDKSVCVWNIETGEIIAGPFEGHSDSVHSVAYSPDGRHVVSGSDDTTVCVWEVETGNSVAGPFGGHTDSIFSIAYSPDGRHIVSGSKDKTVLVWEVENDQIVAGPFEGHTGSVWSVAYSPDGKHVVSGSEDKTVCMWNIETGKIVAGPFEGHTDSVYSVAYSPDGKHVVSGSKDRTVCIWDIQTSKIVAGPFEGHTDFIWSVAYSPNGERVVSGSEDKTVRVWDVETGKIVAGPFQGHTSCVSSVTYSPDGKHVVSGSKDKTVCVWDVETGKIIAGPFEGHTDSVYSVAYSPDGKHVVSGSIDRTVRVWDVETGKIVAGPFEGHTSPVWSVAYSTDGKHVTSGSADKSVRMWDIEIGKIVADPFEGHTGCVSSVAYSPDGKQVVSDSDDNTVRVWDVETGKIVAGPFEGYTDSVCSVAYSPDGKHVVSGSHDETVCVWDVETGEIIAGPFEGHTDSVLSVAYSPDGKHVVSGSHDATVCVWDVETGKIVAGPFEGHTNSVWSVAYSPDGKHVVSGSEDETVCVWDIKTGKIVAGPFEGHADSVYSVAYSPNGKHIVSGSQDETVCVWDIETGKIVAGPFEGRTDSVCSVAYSPDGKHVFSGSAGKTVHVWDVETGQSLPAASKNDILRSIVNSFHMSHRSKGWVRTTSTIWFWVPPHARQGLCDGKAVSVFGVHSTRLDLSRFMHGSSWTDCHPHPFTTPVQLPLPDVSSDPHPHTPWMALLTNTKVSPSQMDYLRLRWISLVLIPLIAIIVFYLHGTGIR